MGKRIRRNRQAKMSHSRRGGVRVGAGRPKSPDSGVSHNGRPKLSGREPVHITLQLCEHIWQLRSRRCFNVIREALAEGCDRYGLRVTSVSAKARYINLVAEAASAKALSRGMQGLTIRLSRGFNRLMGRTGTVFADRYQVHVLRTPVEVRAALESVAGNIRRRVSQRGRKIRASSRDPYAVGYFGNRTIRPSSGPLLVVEPRTLLLRTGWRLDARQDVRRAVKPSSRLAKSTATPRRRVRRRGARRRP